MAVDENFHRDRAIRHALEAERYNRGQIAEHVGFLNSAIEDMRDRLAKRLARIDERGYDLGPASTQALRDLLDETTRTTEAVYKRINAGLKTSLTDYGSYEVEWAEKGLRDALGDKISLSLPNPTKLRRIVEKSPIDGYLLDSWTKHLSTQHQGRIEKEIRQGIFQAQTTDQIVQRIVGTRKNQYRDGVVEMSRTAAASLVLTANSTIANNSRMEVYQRNADRIPEVEWLATLDTRTTSGCQQLDGQTFPVGEAPPCPRHVRCRSVLIPVPRTQVEGRKRASMDGPVSRNTKYGDWLKDQSEERQNEVLGKDRAELFRSGKVEFKDLFRDNGTYRSLDELRRGEGMPAKPKAKPVTVPKVTPKPAPTPRIDTAAIDTRERAYLLERGQKTGVEHLVAYDERTGIVIERKKGKKSSVALSPDLLRAIDDPANAIVMHHNHPGSSSLSLPDLMIAQRPGAAAIWAHGHNGSSYYGARGARPLQKATAQAISSAIRAKLQVLVTAGTVSVDDAMLLHNHLTWLALARTEQIVYRAELSGESKEAFERNKEIYEKILEELK